MAIGMSRRNCLWFGTIERPQWFATPNRGADTGATGWSSGGVLVNGGGYETSSWGSHRQYIFEWPNSSSVEVAQKMKSYADGSYGRGLIYFHLPNSYTTNVLPAALADPSMTIGYEGTSLVYGVEPTAMPISINPNDLPVSGAMYNLNNVTPGFRGTAQAIYVPIPEGHTLMLGAFYSASGSGGVFVSEQLSGGGISSTSKLTELSISETGNVTPDAFSNISGVWIWIGRSLSNTSSVLVQGMIGRLIRTDKFTSNHPERTQLETKPWMGGDGNSGCRFVGKPTRTENYIDGVGFACTLREVGLWSNG